MKFNLRGMRHIVTDIPWPKTPLDGLVWAAVSLGLIIGSIVLVWLVSGGNRIDIDNDSILEGTLSPITGRPCANPMQRPLAVMMASDSKARPLSGIADAELVIEMPVTPNGITRLMAVFQCTGPIEIGSIRSARQDFIGLAQGMNAMYAHWGGEQDALNRLDDHVIDNIDALVYEGSVFYRKTGIPQPHDGFTTTTRLLDKAEDLGYEVSADVRFWPHRTERPSRSLGNAVNTVSITYPTGSVVRWEYEEAARTWLRIRDDIPETDALDERTVRAGAVILLETNSRFLYDQYISVRMTGSGQATLYQDGTRRSIRWSKPAEESPLIFWDENNEPVALAPGPVWISVITPNITIR